MNNLYYVYSMTMKLKKMWNKSIVMQKTFKKMPKTICPSKVFFYQKMVLLALMVTFINMVIGLQTMAKRDAKANEGAQESKNMICIDGDLGRKIGILCIWY